MGADRALAEDDQVARQDVGALDRDGDGHGAVERAQIITGAVDHGAAGMDVHRVVDRAAHALGGVVLHDARDHRRLDALVQRGASQAPGGLHQVGIARQPRQPFLHALELADGDAELLAHAGVHAGGVRAHRGGGGRQRRQRNAAARRQRAHQHLPAVSGALGAADQRVQRYEHVAPIVGAVLEDLHGGQVAASDLHARRFGRHQRDRYADILGAAEDAVRVRHLESQAQHRRHRSQRDVALVPVQPDADQFAPIDLLAADHAGIHHGRGVRSGLGTGQAEARHLAAIRQPWQPVVALRRRAKLHQQFTGAQGIGHHDRNARSDGIGRDAPHDLGVRIRRKTQAAVAPRNDHAEEAFGLQEVPDLGRQVAAVPGNVPFVQHGAEPRQRAVDEALLVRRQRGGWHVQQLAPIGIAGEQIRVPPGVSGFDGLALRGRHGRQRVARPAISGFRDAAAAPGIEVHECSSLLWPRPQGVSGQSTRIGGPGPSCGQPTLRQWATARSAQSIAIRAVSAC